MTQKLTDDKISRLCPLDSGLMRALTKKIAAPWWLTTQRELMV